MAMKATLARCGAIDLDEAVSQPGQVKNESDTLRFRLAEVDAQLNEAVGSAGKYSEAKERLATLAE